MGTLYIIFIVLRYLASSLFLCESAAAIAEEARFIDERPDTIPYTDAPVIVLFEDKFNPNRINFTCPGVICE